MPNVVSSGADSSRIEGLAVTSVDETERVRAIYDRMADRYDRQIATWERWLLPDGREWVCTQVRGDVLEIGVGSGRSLAAYPRDVRLVGIDSSPGMLALARGRARQLGLDIDLRLGDAQALPFNDEAFDTVVVMLSLCSIPDDAQAVREMVRVLKRGGRLVWLEHVRSHIAPVRWIQRLLDPIFVRTEGDHQLRDPMDHLTELPVVIERLARSKLGYIERGVARKT